MQLRGPSERLQPRRLSSAGAAPAPGRPGIFALGAPGVLEHLLSDAGFVGVEGSAVPVSLDMASSEEAMAMMQEAFGAYRAVVRDRSQAEQMAAWKEVEETLKGFQTPTGFVAPGEVLVAAGVKPA